ncbi:MAG: hypothetical protein J5855_03205 [Mailhella sp.]|nr:hypothetical protein [Mailhella sp.]
MGKRTPVKDITGRFLAMIDTAENGDQLLLDWPSQKILAQYRKKSDTTIDFQKQKLVGKGNLIMMFIKKQS